MSEDRIKISHHEAEASVKTLIDRVNLNPGTGIMGAKMVDTFKTEDGRTLIYEWGNGYGEWFEQKESA